MSDRIEFEEFRGENGGNWMGTSMNFPQYTQVGVCSEEQRRLIFEWQKGRLELDKNQEKNNQRLAYEKESQAMKVYFDAFRTLLGAEVYRNAGGILVYAVTDPDGQTIRSRKLLSVDTGICTDSTLFLRKKERILSLLTQRILQATSRHSSRMKFVTAHFREHSLKSLRNSSQRQRSTLRKDLQATRSSQESNLRYFLRGPIFGPLFSF